MAQMSDITELHSIRERLAAAENAHDADVLINLMAEDVVLMVPDFSVQEGRAASARFMRDVTEFFRESANRHITYVSAEVRIIGEAAFDRGTFSFTFESKDGEESVVETGKYLWMYSRESTRGWRMWRMIVSLDQRDDEE
jgi:uncharacterized protein (TIGR02246 family)